MPAYFVSPKYTTVYFTKIKMQEHKYYQLVFLTSSDSTFNLLKEQVPVKMAKLEAFKYFWDVDIGQVTFPKTQNALKVLATANC